MSIAGGFAGGSCMRPVSLPRSKATVGAMPLTKSRKQRAVGLIFDAARCEPYRRCIAAAMGLLLRSTTPARTVVSL
jgi:hypothetical protein